MTSLERAVHPPARAKLIPNPWYAVLGRWQKKRKPDLEQRASSWIKQTNANRHWIEAKLGVMDDCRKWKVRKKVGYEAQQRFWISKGWEYRQMNLFVRFNRWCKLIGNKEIWAFEYEVCERHSVYCFVVGTGPCTNLASIQRRRTNTASKAYGWRWLTDLYDNGGFSQSSANRNETRGSCVWRLLKTTFLT